MGTRLKDADLTYLSAAGGSEPAWASPDRQRMVVDMKSGLVYSLESTGTTVWEMLSWQAGAQHLRVEKLPSRICELRMENEPHQTVALGAVSAPSARVSH